MHLKSSLDKIIEKFYSRKFNLENFGKLFIGEFGVGCVLCFLEVAFFEDY